MIHILGQQSGVYGAAPAEPDNNNNENMQPKHAWERAKTNIPTNAQYAPLSHQLYNLVASFQHAKLSLSATQLA